MSGMSLRLMPGEYWPAGLPPHPHLSADGFQGHCRSYQPRPGTRYLHVKSNSVTARVYLTLRQFIAATAGWILTYMQRLLSSLILSVYLKQTFIWFILLQITHKKRDLMLDEIKNKYRSDSFDWFSSSHNTQFYEPALFVPCCVSRV